MNLPIYTIAKQDFPNSLFTTNNTKLEGKKKCSSVNKALEGSMYINSPTIRRMYVFAEPVADPASLTS